MEMPTLEIKALAGILDDLDYYQLLHVKPSATRAEIREAYHQTSRTFHPDVNRHLDADAQNDCELISKRVTEAYCVLRDPRRRKVYDERLQADGKNQRMQLSEAQAEHVKKDTAERKGQTPQGRQFYQKAMRELETGRVKEAAQHLQMALTFEPGNTHFKDKLAELRRRSK